jgi:hypothetical protein
MTTSDFTHSDFFFNGWEKRRATVGSSNATTLLDFGEIFFEAETVSIGGVAVGRLCRIAQASRMSERCW